MRVQYYSRWGEPVWQTDRAAALTGKMTPHPDVVISLSLLLKPLAVRLLCEPKATPSSSSCSHVICPPLQFTTAPFPQQLLVGFVRPREWRNRGWLMVLLGVFVFRYVLLAGSLVLRGGGSTLLYTTEINNFF